LQILNLVAGFHISSASNFLNVRHELVRQRGVLQLNTSPSNMLTYEKNPVCVPYNFPGGKRQWSIAKQNSQLPNSA